MKKCTACKIERVEDDFMSITGREFNQCIRCRDMKRNKLKCECGKEKKYCKEHGGGGLCECGKRKGRCKEHGGSAFCPCGKEKTHCKEHGGGALCDCGKQKSRCREHGGGALCECGKRKEYCKEHGGGALCECGKTKANCKQHGDEVLITIKSMVSSSRATDKKYDRYDANNHIDYLFIESLIEDYGTNCYYCKKETQFKNYGKDLITIERIDNTLGHIKSNCVLCCFNCNCRRIGCTV